LKTSSEGSSILSTQIQPLLLADSYEPGKGGRDNRDIRSQAGQEQPLCADSAGDQVAQISTASKGISWMTPLHNIPGNMAPAGNVVFATTVDTANKLNLA
jgi:hypothetical protein